MPPLIQCGNSSELKLELGFVPGYYCDNYLIFSMLMVSLLPGIFRENLVQFQEVLLS